MKLVFHWHSVITGETILGWFTNNQFYQSYVGRGVDVKINKLYILTDEKNMYYMRLSKYKRLLKKL